MKLNLDEIFHIVVGLGIFVYFAFVLKNVFIDKNPSKEFVLLARNTMFQIGLFFVFAYLVLKRKGYFPAFILAFTALLAYIYVNSLKFRNWVSENFDIQPDCWINSNQDDNPIGKAYSTSSTGKEGDVKKKSNRRLYHIKDLLQNKKLEEIPYEGNQTLFIPTLVELDQCAGRAYPFKPNVNLRFMG